MIYSIASRYFNFGTEETCALRIDRLFKDIESQSQLSTSLASRLLGSKAVNNSLVSPSLAITSSVAHMRDSTYPSPVVNSNTQPQAISELETAAGTTLNTHHIATGKVFNRHQ